VKGDAGGLFTKSVKRRPASFSFSAALVGLVLRLAFSLGYWTNQPLTRDEQEYLSLARSLAAGHGFTYDAALLAGDPDPVGRAPGYPAFLALVGGGAEMAAAVPAPVKIAQAVTGAIGVLLIGLIAGRLAGPAAGSGAAMIAACYPPLVWISGYAYSEAIAWPLGLALVWLFDRALSAQGSAHRLTMALCGALSGLAILIRPSTLLFVLLGTVWLVWQRKPALAMVLAAGAILVVAPWSARNYREYGRFVPIATEGGVTFWTGNHPLAIGEGDFAANPDLKRDYLALRSRYPALREEQMEPVYYGEALAWIRAHPWRWLTLEARKLFYLLVPIGPSYRLHSLRYYAASAVSYALLLPAALIGAWRMGARRRLAPGLWLLGAAAVVASLVFFPQERFRIPVIDPVLVVCAGALFPFEEVRRDAVRRTT
jgi:4-amino-4-deoxy-L-arabinose transferase-like glycosyltransferase